MTVLWTTSELPGLAFDPEPDDDDAPWCSYLDLDLGGQGVSAYRLATMTTLTVNREYL